MLVARLEEMLLARDVLMFFGCRVEASLHMDSAAAPRDLETRRRRESQIVGSTNVVVTTGGQSENTHTQDSEIE